MKRVNSLDFHGGVPNFNPFVHSDHAEQYLLAVIWMSIRDKIWGHAWVCRNMVYDQVWEEMYEVVY